MDNPKGVEIDQVKKRLVELLKHDDCPLLWMQGDVNNLAAYLLANGVRLEEKQANGNNASDESKRQIADVIITIEQLKLIFEVGDMVDERIAYKIKRLQEKLGMLEVSHNG